MRVDFGSLRWAILGDPAGLGVELADVTAGDGGEPNVAFLVGDQAVGPGVACLERIFLELSRLRIKPAQLIRSLARVPKRAVGCQCRIVRPRPRRRHIVFLDLHIQRSHCCEPCDCGSHYERVQFAQIHERSPYAEIVVLRSGPFPGRIG